MDVHPKLLDHPFYKAWAAGQVSVESLAAYHRSYARLIERMPSYWQVVLDTFEPDTDSVPPVVEEERSHAVLWEQWGRRLKTPTEVPGMQTVLDALEGMTPSQLLGAIHAFEIQQPGVARTKKEGLIAHYGFDRTDLKYFDEHENEHAHITLGQQLASECADKKEFDEGFVSGARLFYRGLDEFLDR